MLSAALCDLTMDDLVAAERFLSGFQCSDKGREYDPIRAHEAVKGIYSAGQHKYPHLFEKSKRYVHGYEFDSLEGLSRLPSGSKQEALNVVLSQRSGA
jgi:hypothetical protein